MADNIVSVSLVGPLFAQCANDIVQELTELGMERLTSAFPTGVPVKTGNYRRNINPTIHGASAQLDDNGVVYGSWLEGTSSRNETSRFKGYATFRRTGDWLQEQAEDICQKHAAKLASALVGQS